MKLLTGNEIPPGGEGKVAVYIKTGNRNRKVRQVVKVQTNDPEKSAFSLTVQANVIVDLDVLPNNILRFDPKQSDMAAVTIKSYSEHLIQLTDVKSTNPYVEISLSSGTIEPLGEVIVTGRLLPDLPKKEISGWLTIQTDLKTVPTIQIRIWGNNQ